MSLPISPMLVGRTEKPLLKPGFANEIKQDGYRAIVTCGKRDGVRIWSRHGTELTARLPELQAIRELVRKPVIFDAELVVNDDRGYPRFERMLRNDCAHSLVVFDILREGQRWLIDRPWLDRRARLEYTVVAESPQLLVSRLFADGAALLDECERRAIEGIVQKDESAKYVSGRSNAWLKCKTTYGKQVTRARMQFQR